MELKPAGAAGSRAGAVAATGGGKVLKQLKGSVPPALPSGPPELKQLQGRCFDMTQGQ